MSKKTKAVLPIEWFEKMRREIRPAEYEDMIFNKPGPINIAMDFGGEGFFVEQDGKILQTGKVFLRDEARPLDEEHLQEYIKRARRLGNK